MITSKELDKKTIELRDTSMREKLSPAIVIEEGSDEHLDYLLNLKQHVCDITAKIIETTFWIENLSWHTFENEKDLSRIQDFIAQGRDLAVAIERRYKPSIVLSNRKLFQDELDALYNSTADFRESIDDIEYTFFVARQDDEINNIAKSIGK